MPTPIFQALGLHLIGPFAVALLLFQLYRSFRSTYLVQWTLSFLALTLFHFAIAMVVIGTEGVVPHRPTLMVASVAGAAAAYLQLAWMVWGSIEIAKRKTLRIQDSRRLLLLLGVAGIASGSIPFILGQDSAIHRFFFMALHSLAAAVVFIACGIGIRRLRGAGFTIPMIAFSIYGLVQLDVFILLMRSLINRATPTPLFMIGVADVSASAVVVLGIVLTVLEDQHEAGIQVTSQVEKLAYYDTLTGLPNRTLFTDRLTVALAHAQRHKYKLAVLFLDIDRFKQINDSLGHTVGDRLLKIVSSRIQGAIRDEDTVARFGGDEFTILIHIIGKVEDAGKVAQKVLDALKVPIAVDEREFVITSSVGISIFPNDGPDGETLIRNADTSMYRAKDLGRNTLQYYAATMNHKALEALEVENGIRRALTQGEFTLYYQPLIDMTTGSVFGLEALIRWNHPELGLLRPDRFIPAAEQSGLIVSIDRWVLKEACMQAAEWHRQGHKLVMAVNLSGRQFGDPNLTDHVREALETAGLRPQFLELEITEHSAMENVEKAITTLQAVKALGVRIAIDDFGTGYSCLSYLKHFPIDTLKLDGSFVRDLASPEDAQIALGVIALAHSLKLKVIAEGVETISQLNFLREHACDRLQGYLFSRPMPPANFDRFMDQREAFKYTTSH